MDPHSPRQVEKHEQALAQFVLILEDLRARGVGVVLASPTPLFEYIPLRCSDWFNEMNPVCSGRAEIPKAELMQRAAPAFAQLDAVVDAVPGVVDWDVFDVLCPGEMCSVYDADGRLLFEDQDHLGGRGNEAVLPSMRDAVAAAVAPAHRPGG